MEENKDLKHGKVITYRSMYYQCHLAIHQLITITFHGTKVCQNIGKKW